MFDAIKANFKLENESRLSFCHFVDRYTICVEMLARQNLCQLPVELKFHIIIITNGVLGYVYSQYIKIRMQRLEMFTK